MTFTYKKKTRQIQVVSSESEPNLLLCDQSELGATHVVTEVKTGFSAVLNFESEINENENMTKKEVAKSLNVLVHSLPSEGIEGMSRLVTVVTLLQHCHNSLYNNTVLTVLRQFNDIKTV